MTNFINFDSLTSRDDAMTKIIGVQKELRNSEIWNIGTEFRTFLGDYMTVQQVAKFFDTTDEAVKEHSRSKKSEHKKELEDMGVKQYDYYEIKNMKDNFLRENRILVHDETKNYKVNAKGCKLYPLKAVCRLGMFMTKTEKAKEFRDKIMDTIIKSQRRLDVKNIIKDSYFKYTGTDKRVYISITDALEKIYENNPQYKKLSANDVYKILSNGIKKVDKKTNKQITLGGFGVLTPKSENIKNQRVTDEYSFLRDSFKLNETAGSFNGHVNKFGYAVLDILIKVYNGDIILEKTRDGNLYKLNSEIESGKTMRKLRILFKNDMSVVENLFIDLIFFQIDFYKSI